MVICNYCGKEKLEMDMNTEDLCKNCWVKKLDKKRREAAMKGWITYRKNRELAA